MRRLCIMVLAAGALSAQETPEFAGQVDTTGLPEIDARSNAYIHEDWAYFAERLRNEFLALGEKKYRRREYQAAVLEYFNFLLHFPEDGLVPLVHYRMGRAYHRIGELALAGEQYRLAREHPQADARVQVVAIRQLARLDLDAGRDSTVLALTLDNDPYVLVLKGFAALTLPDWQRSEGYFSAARRYYPLRGRAILDRIIADLQALHEIKYFSKLGGRFWSLTPGGGHARLGLWGEALGFGVSVGTLTLAAVLAEGWTRYVMVTGAVLLYWWSGRAASRELNGANAALLQSRLDEIRARYNVDTLWSFAHPAIF